MVQLTNLPCAKLSAGVQSCKPQGGREGGKGNLPQTYRSNSSNALDFRERFALLNVKAECKQNFDLIETI